MERQTVGLVEFSNGERMLRGGRYDAWKSGAEYIRDTYNSLIREAEERNDREEVKSLFAEGMGALTEFKAASAKRGDFALDPLVRVTAMEVY